MKKDSFKPLLSGLLFGVGVFCMGYVAFGATNLENLKSYKNNNQLTATNWDTLIDEMYSMDNSVANLLSKITNLNSQITNLTTQITNLENTVNNPTTVADVPSGAVMAFDLASCPSGWTRFSDADGRFIMGATTNSKEKGGNSSVMLQANNLAPHSHRFADSFFAENVTYSSHGTSPALNFRAGVDTASGRGWYGSDEGGDRDNYLQVVWRKTGSKLVDGPENVKSNTPGNVTDGAKAYDWQSGMPDYGSLGSQQSVNIQNPYVKLIYCKKN